MSPKICLTETHIPSFVWWWVPRIFLQNCQLSFLRCLRLGTVIESGRRMAMRYRFGAPLPRLWPQEPPARRQSRRRTAEPLRRLYYYANGMPTADIRISNGQNDYPKRTKLFGRVVSRHASREFDEAAASSTPTKYTVDGRTCSTRSIRCRWA